MDLRLDDIDAGHFLSDRVLDLDARIDLDEVERTRLGIHEEFDSAGTDVTGFAGQLQRIARQLLALRGVEIGCRRALHDFLVAALHRAVALEQMHLVAMRVAQHLHLDMAGAFDQLFQINLILAKGGPGLAFGLVDLALQIIGAADDAHAAPAAAP